MEGVERHLSGGLSDRLGRDCADHLSRVNHRVGETRSNLANNPIKGFACQVVLLNHPADCKRRTDQHAEQQSCVVLCLHTDAIRTTDDNQLLLQVLDALQDVARIKVTGSLVVDVEHLLGVPDITSDIGRHGPLIVTLCEDVVAEQAAIIFQLLELGIQQRLHGADIGPRPAGPGSISLLQRLEHRIVECAWLESFGFVRQLNLELSFKLSIGHLDSVQALFLDVTGVHTIFTITELDHMAEGVSDGAVVLDHHILQRLDQTTLNITSLGSLDSSINQT
jgi:hypothetical protein